MTAALAGVKDSATFVGTSELLGVVSDFFLAAFLARMLDDGAGLHVLFSKSLDFGAFGTKSRGEGVRLGASGNDFG